MNIYRTTTVALAAVLGTGSLAFATDHQAHKGHDMPAKHMTGDHAMDPEVMAAMKASYPMETCVVSGDDLGGGDMEPFDYIHKQDGKADRLVRFCCKDCLRDFKGDPEHYLGMLDKAAKKRAAGVDHKMDQEVGDKGHSDHAGHNH